MINFFKRQLNDNQISKPFLYVAFCLYAFFLFWIIGLKFNAEWLPEIGEYMRRLSFSERVGAGIIPFRNLYVYIVNEATLFHIDYFLNYIIYIPLGLLLPLMVKKHPYWTAIVATVVSSFIFELVQYFTGFGGCDGTDFAMNLLGGFTGAFLVYLFKPHLSNKAINYINLVAIILLLPVCIFGFVNTLLHLNLYKIY